MRKDIPVFARVFLTATLFADNIAYNPPALSTFSQKAKPQDVFVPLSVVNRKMEEQCLNVRTMPTIENFARTPALDVPERQILGYTWDGVQARTYHHAISYVWVPNRPQTELVLCSIPNSMGVWLSDQVSSGVPQGLNWVKNKKFGQMDAVLTPEPLDSKVMLAISW